MDSRLGCIIRNHQGAVTAAVTSKKPYLGDVETAEALAILEGLKAHSAFGRVVRAAALQCGEQQFEPPQCNCGGISFLN